MRRRFHITIILLPVLGLGSLPAQGVRPPTSGPVIIKRVDPTTIDSLPVWLRDALKKRACLIPQMHSADLLNNIRRGFLVDSVTESYVLLCSNGRESSVVVATKDAVLAPPPILDHPDTSFLVFINEGTSTARREFGRFLDVIEAVVSAGLVPHIPC